MNRIKFLTIALIAGCILTSNTISAQEEVKEETTTEKESLFSIGADLVSGYVWRGTKVHGASIQPTFAFGIGGFEIGAWGAYEIAAISGIPAEADLYASYAFDFGLSLGVTDYYYPGGEGYFEYSDTAGTHAFEANLGYEIKDFYVGANYIFNKAGFAASEGGDMYFELGYNFKHFSAFAGAGNGWHSTFEDNGDDKFAICNIGLSTSKDIKITDNYSLPIFGSVSVNPDRKHFNIVVGVSF